MAPPLLYATLESHRGERWEALGLHMRFSYDWFVAVQARLQRVDARTRGDAAVRAILADVLRVARAWREEEETDPVAAATARAVEHRATTARRDPNMPRRMYNAANWAFYHTHNLIREPLALPPPRTQAAVPWADEDDELREDAKSRVFCPAEVEALIQAADRRGRRSGIFLRLLFTTGLRIAAAARLRWRQVLEPDAGAVRPVVGVREKCRITRFLVLTPELRAILLTEWSSLAKEGAPPRVLPYCVRHLRNIFYRACRDAGLRGAHCTPHTARHTSNPLLDQLHKEGVVRGRASFIRSGQQRRTHCQVPWTQADRDHQRLLLEIVVPRDRRSNETALVGGLTEHFFVWQRL